MSVLDKLKVGVDKKHNVTIHLHETTTERIQELVERYGHTKSYVAELLLRDALDRLESELADSEIKKSRTRKS